MADLQYVVSRQTFKKSGVCWALTEKRANTIPNSCKGRSSWNSSQLAWLSSVMWCSGGDGRVHTSGSPQLCFLRAEKFQGSAFGWSADDESAIHLRPAIPPLFHRSYKVRPRKHGEETVAICGGCFITGAGRVALVCWPAVVDGLPKKKNKTR